jgi:UDP-3-O-[3-hydroxymyristoyl] glucosamine N-acyltransferase
VVATVEQLAALVGGRVIGDGSVPIGSAKPVSEAGPGDITFVDDERYARHLHSSPVSAALVGPHFRIPGNGPAPALIEVDDPRAAFIAVRGHLAGDARARATGIHEKAHVAPSARLGADVVVLPFACVGDEAELGDGCTIHPGAVVGARCKLGKGVVLHPHAVLYEGVVLGDRVEVHSGTVLGADGFGYRVVEGRHVKIPQTGGLEIGADVEIGANCTIDRGTFAPTTVGEGSKIDNLVMIGHNNRIGRHNLLCGQVGIGGSCTTGDYVVMAGKAGIKDHVEIGDRAVVGAQAGVHRNIPAGEKVLGSPAIPVREQRRLFQMIARLPEMYKQLRALSALAARHLPAGEVPQHPASDEEPIGF